MNRNRAWFYTKDIVHRYCRDPQCWRRRISSVVRKNVSLVNLWIELAYWNPKSKVEPNKKKWWFYNDGNMWCDSPAPLLKFWFVLHPSIVIKFNFFSTDQKGNQKCNFSWSVWSSFDDQRDSSYFKSPPHNMWIRYPRRLSPQSQMRKNE